MDTFTSANVQMTDHLSPLKIHHDDDDSPIFEVDENQENNGLKRQRLSSSECVQMAKIRNKLPAQQPCAEHQNRCISTPNDASINATNGTIHVKATHITNPNDTSQSNGFYHNENSRDGITTTRSSDDCHMLTNLCDGQNEGYFNAMVASDLCEASRKLVEEKEKCTNNSQLQLNGNSDPNNDHVIAKGHRRTRARSSDSVQAEFYQARKQQLRLQSQKDSDVSSNIFRF